jgi:hypothetical protein
MWKGIKDGVLIIQEITIVIQKAHTNNLSTKENYAMKQPVYQDTPECWRDLGTETQDALCDWIHQNIQPRKTANLYHTSYGLKHIFQHDTGTYVYNGQFKAAMLRCGYKPVDDHEQNWNYCISQRSSAFDWKKRSRIYHNN